MSAIVDERTARLASEPMVAAGPTRGFVRGTFFSIKDIWAHRELLGMLVRRELKARYKDSTLGFFWSLLRPLALLAVYYVAIGKFLGAQRNTPDFAVFIYAGLTAWNLFAEVVGLGTNSIIANAGLVKKVYLPREVFPLSVVGSALFNFGIQLVILIGATFLVGKPPTGDRLLFAVLSVAVILVWSTALAFLLSAVNVYLRDVAYLVEIVLMFMFWSVPVVYTWQAVSQHVTGTLETIYLANPMALAVFGFQRAFWVRGDAQKVPPHIGQDLVISLLIGLVFLWIAQRVFARLQSNFAQEL
ncbi:ABC transporter permease [Jatrophihabitans sp. DSM 45814]